MCDRGKATTTYGFPVCEPCRVWLVGVDAELKALEAADPDLKAAGAAVDDAWDNLRNGPTTTW